MTMAQAFVDSIRRSLEVPVLPSTRPRRRLRDPAHVDGVSLPRRSKRVAAQQRNRVSNPVV
uniref:Uncharacterized protein n=1 Tax=Arundo donax TaxID=35708 RepID=A0A0A9D9I9_ARUDO